MLLDAINYLQLQWAKLTGRNEPVPLVSENSSELLSELI